MSTHQIVANIIVTITEKSLEKGISQSLAVMSWVLCCPYCACLSDCSAAPGSFILSHILRDFGFTLLVSNSPSLAAVNKLGWALWGPSTCAVSQSGHPVDFLPPRLHILLAEAQSAASVSELIILTVFPFVPDLAHLLFIALPKMFACSVPFNPLQRCDTDSENSYNKAPEASALIAFF